MENGAPPRLTRAALSVGSTSSSGPENSNEFQEEEIVFAEEILGDRAVEPSGEDSVDVRLAASGAGKVGRWNRRRGSSARDVAGGTAARGMIAISESERGSSGQCCVPRHQSAPLNIPPWPRTSNSRCFTIDEYDEEEGEEQRTAPHELLARMNSNFMTFSVCEGFGRTLKGRDLSQVRNAVLRQTGFID